MGAFLEESSRPDGRSMPKPCIVGRAVTKLSKADLADWRLVERDVEHFTHAAVSEALERRLDTPPNRVSIIRHRLGRCSCYRSENS